MDFLRKLKRMFRQRSKTFEIKRIPVGLERQSKRWPGPSPEGEERLIRMEEKGVGTT